MAVIAALLPACAASPESAQILRVSLESIEPATQAGQVTLQLNLHNDADTVLPVTGVDYRVAFNGLEFAYGSSRQTVDVPPRGAAVFDLTMAGDMPQALPQQDKAGQLAYTLSGWVRLTDGQGDLPFQHAGTLAWYATSHSE